MHFVNLDKKPIDNLSIEAQQEQMWLELDRIDRELPIGAVIDERREAQAHHGNPYETWFDGLMWYVGGNPYETMAPKTWCYQPDVGMVNYGLRLFSGMTPSGELLFVTGALDSKLLSKPAGYRVHSHYIAKSEAEEWQVSDIEMHNRGGVLDIALTVGQGALSLVPDNPKSIEFRTPSVSQASLKENGEVSQYSRSLLKNLYSVVQAFDKKYGHLEVLYNWPPQHAPAEVELAAA